MMKHWPMMYMRGSSLLTNTASQADSSNAYSYFVDALAEQVMQDLQEQLWFF